MPSSKNQTETEKNKGGRPPKELNRQAYTDAFFSVVTVEAMQKLTKKMLSMAMSGDRELGKYLHDRVHGRPGDSLDVTSDGKPVEVHMFLPKKNAKEE